ncbi:rhodanese-like domain-containing protein [Burkholderiaceae bacterium UC74_6]
MAEVHSSFYKFASVDDPAALAEALRERVAGLGGNILVAPEGISGAIAGEPQVLHAFEASLTRDFGGIFEGMGFKHSACTTRPFHLIKVHVKKEIVAFGVPGVSGAAGTSSHVSPQAFRALLDEPDVVVLDNRNSFEFRLGHFRNAIDPGVANFRDFPAYVQEHADEWKREGKRIAMYCTGGIRCEKTAAWMQEQGLTVHQLDGGIVNYFASVLDANRDWSGECFVFDKRIAIDTHLQETATTAEEAYEGDPQAEWRLARAQRLDPTS